MMTFKQAAAIGYQVFIGDYQLDTFSGNFWFGGNSLHAGLAYLVAAGEPDRAGILTTAWNIYDQMHAQTDWWRDDYSWWGNAFMFAVANRQQLGYGNSSNDPLFDNLVRAAQDCWDKLEDNWRNTNYNGNGEDHADGKAAITGGVFNTLTQPGDMAGRNCVTNEGYWILSHYLAAMFPTNPMYAQSQADELAWFQKWVNWNDPPNRNGLIDANGLVLERPLGNATVPDWYWTGDQGLFMHALAMPGQNPQGLGITPVGIAKSVIRSQSDAGGVLHENMGFAAQLGQFVADYATGKGIFMRCLAQLNGATSGQPFTSWIVGNARAVWRSRSMPGDRFAFNWNALVQPQPPLPEPVVLRNPPKSETLCNLIMQTAGLEALSAALMFAPDEAVD